MDRYFNLIVEQDEDGYYVGSVPELKGCYTQAKSLDELNERIKEVIELCLEVEEEDYKPLNFIGIQRVAVAV